MAGSTTEDSDGVLLYDGAALAARHDAVVVTTNYRLGAVGFLAHPALEAPDGGNGNWGIRDQALALRWVRDNIAAAGGDPTRVLLFGESAGALDTCTHLASPGSAGLFSAAAMQSAACVAIDLASAVSAAEAHVETLGCEGDPATCLRSVDAEALATLSEDPISDFGIPSVDEFGPVVDGVILEDVPETVLAAGGAADVPLLVGSNSDETGQWVPSLTEEEYTALVRLVLGRDELDTVLALYPVADYATPREAWIALSTDVSFTCSARRTAVAAAAGNESAVYRCYFSEAPSGPAGLLYGAWHGLELVYVFQHLDDVAEATGYQPDAADVTIESAIGASWRALAATGSPEAAALGEAWPAYGDDVYFEYGDPMGVGADLHADRCDYWDAWRRVAGRVSQSSPAGRRRGAPRAAAALHVRVGAPLRQGASHENTWRMPARSVPS